MTDDLYARNALHPDVIRGTKGSLDAVAYVEAKLRAMVETAARDLGRPLVGSIQITSYEDYPFGYAPEQLMIVFEAHGVIE